MSRKAERSAETDDDEGPGDKRRVFRRRQEILDVAAQIFYEKGYDATSTRDIADAAGLLKGSLYYYVATKEDFLFEIIRQSHEGALATLERVRAVEGDALHRLGALVREHLGYFIENLVRTTIYFREMRTLSPERRAIVAAEGDEYLNFVRDLLLDGQAEGTIAREVDVRLVSIGIVGMLNSAWLWYQPGGSRSTEEIAAEFVKVIVGGVASDRAIDSAGSAARVRAEVAGLKLPRRPAARQPSATAAP